MKIFFEVGREFRARHSPKLIPAGCGAPCPPVFGTWHNRLFRRALIKLIQSCATGIGLAAAALAATPDASPATPLDPVEEASIRAFLSKYCQDCHGPEKQKGERRWDQIALPVTTADAVIDLQDIVDQLNLGEMPPEDAKRKPVAREVREQVARLTRLISEGHSRLASTGGRTILRRLNRREYVNTVADLFGLNMTMFDPTTKFPRDEMVRHMDNIGDTLKTSGFLLAQYLDAADQVVEKVFEQNERPAEQTWHFAGPFRGQNSLGYIAGKAHQYRYLCLLESPASFSIDAAYGHLPEFGAGVPADGWYEIRVRAEARNRVNPYDPKVVGRDPAMPFRLGVLPGNIKVGALDFPQPVEPLLTEVIMKDGGPDWYTLRVWLDRGFTPRFAFLNGSASVRQLHRTLMKDYAHLFPEDLSAIKQVGDLHVVIQRHAQVPQIRIHEVEIRGPLIETWPAPGQRAILGDRPFAEERTREILENFARRAYRRPLRAGESGHLMGVVANRRKQGRTPFEALKSGLKAALCSPAFLYLEEPAGGEEPRTLNAHSLAARLSYFFWATTPDAELQRAAETGELLNQEVLLAQTRRLLASPRSDAFFAGFLDSWLNLRSLGDMPPSRDAFGHVYAENLMPAMKRETQLFARDLADRNESIVRFLDADYTFANRPLARLYGLEAAVDGATGHEFRRIALDNPNRGGLLGQASVLTVSANGVETSPVIRGVWVLDNLLGAPPPPPPDDVPPIDPDIRGAVSMREILAKHRNTPACYDCHRRIDPLGFALENFDPVGAWRETYEKGAPIDSSGELPSGQKFTDIAGLKKHLVGRKAQFARPFVERLLSYACGRRMEPLDRPAVNRILEATVAEDYRFRDLLEQVVLSPTFRSK